MRIRAERDGDATFTPALHEFCRARQSTQAASDAAGRRPTNARRPLNQQIPSQPHSPPCAPTASAFTKLDSVGAISTNAARHGELHRLPIPYRLDACPEARASVRPVTGVILNNVGGEIHAQMIRDAVTGAVPILGALPHANDIIVPKRHLGLHLPHEARSEYVEELATLIEAHIDLDALLGGSTIERQRVPPAAPNPPPRARIAVARDEAFCFYYSDNLELLEQAGAQLVPFSPIREPLPENIDGIYLVGGYPELHADELADNEVTREAIREFAAAGGPIYAECGGLMYLGATLELDSHPYPLCGVLPFSTKMPAPLTLAYVEITTTGGLFGSGQTARGHLFHHSAIAGDPSRERSYTITTSRGEETKEGYQVGNVLASYAHLHLASNPSLASAFVERCQAFRAVPN